MCREGRDERRGRLIYLKGQLEYYSKIGFFTLMEKV
jgi:hypothetical protein